MIVLKDASQSANYVSDCLLNIFVCFACNTNARCSFDTHSVHFRARSHCSNGLDHHKNPRIPLKKLCTTAATHSERLTLVNSGGNHFTCIVQLWHCPLWVSPDNANTGEVLSASLATSKMHRVEILVSASCLPWNMHLALFNTASLSVLRPVSYNNGLIKLSLTTGFPQRRPIGVTITAPSTIWSCHLINPSYSNANVR